MGGHLQGPQQAELPANARVCGAWIEELCGAPIRLIGVGAARDAVIVRRDLLRQTGR